MARHVGFIANLVASAGPRGVWRERNARMDVDVSSDAALGKSVTPSLMCWQLPSPVVFANRWGLGRSTTNVHFGGRETHRLTITVNGRLPI